MYTVQSECYTVQLIRTLPAGVLDIDKKDYENPQLCAEYTQDMYAYLRLDIA